MAWAFKRLAWKLRRQWHSAKSANAIAASIGRKKYWKKAFARKAAAWRRRAARR